MDQRLTASRTLIIVGLVVIVVGAIAWGVYTAVDWATAHGDNDADNPEGIFFVCGQCGHGFVLTVKQFEAHHKAHWGQGVPCPKCGAAKPRKGIRCPHCEGIFPHKRGAEKQICPGCRKPASPPAG